MSVVESENYPARNGDVESDPKLHQRCLKWRNKAITACQLRHAYAVSLDLL